ncbi:MAG: SDR family oxidoreductase [Afipia sp.]|nr:SDR family oxidoreductase [Afipia sp.]
MNSPIVQFSLPQTVVVTGASSGLGQELCRLLIENGVSTIGVDVSDAQASLAEAPGYSHVAGDVGAQATWDIVIDRLQEMDPASLGLVTSAAVLDVCDVTEATPEILSRAMHVNIVGTALAMKALIPLMAKKKAGAVVAVASVNATLAEQQLAVYNATKAAVRQLARTVAVDHAQDGVRTNVLSPGPMLAGLFKRHLESAHDSARFLATRAARQPEGRILEAEEVARAAMFLLSSGAAALRGAEIIADGGLTTSFDYRTGAEGASV